jgi:hypothetical protein
MYDFYYSTMKHLYEKRINIVYSDIDSLDYEIKTHNFFNDKI